MTIIWADWKDEDTKMLEILWSGVNNVNLVHANYFNSVMEKTIDLAIANEKDTLLFCGHGTSYGLLAPKSYGTYMIHQSNANIIQAKNVIGVMCYGAEFAERVGLHGLFTSMFISNINEAVDYGVSTTKNEINSENMTVLQTINGMLRNGTSMENCYNSLKNLINPLSDCSGLMEFNVGGIKLL